MMTENNEYVPNVVALEVLEKKLYSNCQRFCQEGTKNMTQQRTAVWDL